MRRPGLGDRGTTSGMDGGLDPSADRIPETSHPCMAGMSTNPRFRDLGIHLSLDAVAGFYEAGDVRGLQAYFEDEIAKQGAGVPVELRPRRAATTLASNPPPSRE